MYISEVTWIRRFACVREGESKRARERTASILTNTKALEMPDVNVLQSNSQYILCVRNLNKKPIEAAIDSDSVCANSSTLTTDAYMQNSMPFRCQSFTTTVSMKSHRNRIVCVLCNGTDSFDDCVVDETDRKPEMHYVTPLSFYVEWFLLEFFLSSPCLDKKSIGIVNLCAPALAQSSPYLKMEKLRQ